MGSMRLSLSLSLNRGGGGFFGGGFFNVGVMGSVLLWLSLSLNCGGGGFRVRLAGGPLKRVRSESGSQNQD